MASPRKSVRVTIPSEMAGDFEKAKSMAESAVMVKMSDAQYASRLVQWAIAHKINPESAPICDAAVAVTLTDDGFSVHVTGTGRARNIACEMAYAIEWLMDGGKLERLDGKKIRQPDFSIR